MPGMDGFQVAEEIKRASPPQDLTMVMRPFTIGPTTSLALTTWDVAAI
ncbi:MAG: hypothetical protein ABI604_14955 [Nitrospirota bacterium]